MSLRSFSRSTCSIHGDVITQYGQCLQCGVQRPVTVVADDRLSRPSKTALVRRKSFHVFSTGRPRSQQLTHAERRVAEALAEGHDNQHDISAVARVHLGSVSKLIRQAMDRVGVDSREALANYVRSNGQA